MCSTQVTSLTESRGSLLYRIAALQRIPYIVHSETSALLVSTNLLHLYSMNVYSFDLHLSAMLLFSFILVLKYHQFLGRVSKLRRAKGSLLRSK